MFAAISMCYFPPRKFSRCLLYGIHGTHPSISTQSKEKAQKAYYHSTALPTCLPSDVTLYAVCWHFHDEAPTENPTDRREKMLGIRSCRSRWKVSVHCTGNETKESSVHHVEDTKHRKSPHGALGEGVQSEDGETVEGSRLATPIFPTDVNIRAHFVAMSSHSPRLATFFLLGLICCLE